MKTYRKIENSRNARQSSMGPDVRQVIPGGVEHIDPFVFLDHYGPAEIPADWGGVPPHPHAGISTITYLYAGTNRHEDSLGNDVSMSEGDLAWMRAGKGIVHAEGRRSGDRPVETSHGLQFWISLPANDKFIDPDFAYYAKDSLPSFTHEGTEIKVLSGELLGHKSPATSLSPAYIFSLKIPAGNSFELPLQDGDSCGLYMVDGEVNAGDKQLLPTSITSFGTQGDALLIKSLKDSHVVVLGGTPLNEPMVARASYVMNTEEQVHQVMKDYQNGKMGEVAR